MNTKKEREIPHQLLHTFIEVINSFFFTALKIKLKELEEEWEKVDATPPVPTRYTRSQQKKMAENPPPPVDSGESSTDGPGMIIPKVVIFKSLFIILVGSLLLIQILR